MKMMKWMLLAIAIAAVNSQFAVRSHAALFKIDFGQLENEREIVDADGNPTGKFPDPLKDWDIIGTWTFADPAANGGKGVANTAGTEVTWKLKDFSNSGDNDVTLTIMDNKTLAQKVNTDNPPFMLGQTANNPTKDGLAAVYDGVLVPAVVKDDYLYRNPDTGGTEVLMRFANLNPGFYNVTVFEGRTTDSNGRFGKIWVDDINGNKEPAAQNTGNYSGVNDASGLKVPLGQPRTLTMEIKAGEFLWFAEMEDGSGGISGIIIRSASAAPPVVDVAASKGLFKIDFGHLENEREIVDAAGDPTGKFPDPLKDWNVIPTWTFADPAANATAGSASIVGTPNADGTAVTWKLTDFSKDANKNVTVTIFDNKALAEKLSPDGPPYMQGQTANNPTKDGFEAVYDGVVVPAIVKDDYLYRNPDTAGTEALMRFAGLNPGPYNVTVFEGRTSDGNGRFGKIWVDDINGKKEPATQNTGNYSGVNLDVGGVPTPVGQPRTVTVDIKAGEYLWFAEMEDNTGGISGMIIRGITGGPASTEIPTTGLSLWLRADAGVTASASGAVTAWTDQSGSNNNAVQATESKAPKLVASALNGKPVLRFDGVDDYLDVAQSQSLAITGDISSFFVVKFDDFATFRAVWGKTAGPAGNLPAPTDYYTVPNTGLPRLYRGNGTSTPTGLGFVDAAKGLPAATYLVVGFAQQGATLTHYLAGQANGSGQLTATLGDGGKALKIGSREDLFTKMKGDIAELVIYSRALPDAERNQVVDYLKNKYGLGVPAPSKISMARSGTGVILSWEGTGTLESADEVTGPWTTVAGATSPRTVTPSGNRKFYRLKL